MSQCRARFEDAPCPFPPTALVSGPWGQGFDHSGGGVIHGPSKQGALQ